MPNRATRFIWAVSAMERMRNILDSIPVKGSVCRVPTQNLDCRGNKSLRATGASHDVMFGSATMADPRGHSVDITHPRAGLIIRATGPLESSAIRLSS